LVVVALAAAVAVSGCGDARRSTDETFVLLARHPSPDGMSVFLVYQYDNGALGYSRVWWAVVPADYTGINLVPLELPDGYEAVGWTPTGELKIRPWTPYYTTDRSRILRSGGEWCGTKIELLPALGEHEPREWAQPDSARSPK
jgi:hypothetical protein